MTEIESADTPVSDKELRSRVKLLGQLLGNVLKKHEDPAVYRSVEALRRGFIRLRKQDDAERRERLIELIDRLEPPVIEQVIRAYSLYFNLVNIAEEDFQHRVRRRRVRKHGYADWKGSYYDTIRGFHEQGIGQDELQRLLSELSYQPVFTAHPTESKRRTIMQLQRRIFEVIDDLTDPRISGYEKEVLIKRLEIQIEVLWQTNEVREIKPQVADEIKLGLSYFPRSLYKAVRIEYRHLEKALSALYGQDEFGNPLISAPSFIRFGSWIGGDRDGNPYVTPDTTRMALRMHSSEVLGEYITQIGKLTQLLTQSLRWCHPSEAFMHSLERDEALGLKGFDEKRDKFESEIYRRKLYFMQSRLKVNLDMVNARLQGKAVDHNPQGYANAAEFIDDLRLIYDSLLGNGNHSVANGRLKDLIRLAETFGFHLYRLDIRQESTRHGEAVHEILDQAGVADYLSLPEKSRLQFLADQISSGLKPDIQEPNLSAQTLETLQVFQVIHQMREEIDPEAIGSYVISMTHSASHVMEVIYLGYLAGLVGRNRGEYFCQLAVSPLFETIDDLNRIDSILNNLLANKLYRKLLAASSNVQEVMLGYSDSCKDGGIVTSSWGLYLAQKKVVEISRNYDIRCRMFHGRGGTIGRGGGPTHDAILSQPHDTVLGHIKFTEQGEVLSNKYSNTETAFHELSMGITGLMKASLTLVRPSDTRHDHFYADMQQMSDLSEKSYRELTDNTAGFFEYFYQATPVNEIGLMNIGSRPSHRRKGDMSKTSVRAIPWVFGWAQSRHTLPGWYGLGSAIKQWLELNPEDGLYRLKRMYDEWPFFNSMISKTRMALFKSNMTSARYYASLCDNKELAERVFGLVEQENRLTIDNVLMVSGMDRLLAGDLLLELSLNRREPYLDPLGYIQISLLRKYRAEDERWQDALLSSINAIAAAMRNTG